MKLFFSNESVFDGEMGWLMKTRSLILRNAHASKHTTDKENQHGAISGYHISCFQVTQSHQGPETKSPGKNVKAKSRLSREVFKGLGRLDIDRIISVGR